MACLTSAARSLVLSALAASAVLAAVAPAHAAAPLSLGMQDPLYFQGIVDPNQRALALTRSREAGASSVRLGVSWRYVASRRPSRAQARNPRWAGYCWQDVDAEVRAVVAAGMQPLLVVTFAPAWAEGRRRPERGPVPPKAPDGSWRPSPVALGDFARAMAKRFDGRTRDASGALLPRVRQFQAWNEPNLTEYLTPQRGGAAAGIYRSMLRAFHASVKGVRRDNLVLAAGLAPFGDHRSTDKLGRTPPIDFLHRLLCLRPRGRCPRLPFDAFAAHAFPGADPRTRPANKGDIRLRMNEVMSALRSAARRGTISARQARSLWMTELGIPGGGADGSFPYEVQATYLQLSLYLLWRDGVDMVHWYGLRDRPEPNFVWQMGLYKRGSTVEADEAKPALTAFRFPFLALRSGGRVVAWGRAPSGTEPVVIERSEYPDWREVARVAPGSARVFNLRIEDPGDAQLRARQGSVVSLASGVTSARP